MIFKPWDIAGACLIEIEPREDRRGFYARSFSVREFEANGLKASFVEGGVSYSPRRGTVRGMHLQAAPHAQAKLIRCTRGAIYDVIIDLRRESPTYGRWAAVSLSAPGTTMLYVPEECAHGFQTTEDHTEVTYQLGAYYHPEVEIGVRWNEPRFAIPWPIADVIVSDRDRSFDDFQG